MNDNPQDPAIPAPVSSRHEGAWERETIEKLVFETLREQRAARRWKLFFRLIWLAILGALVWMWVKQADNGQQWLSQLQTMEAPCGPSLFDHNSS